MLRTSPGFFPPASVSKEDVKKLLTCISAGQISAAEKLIQQNKSLLLGSSCFNDNVRTFMEVTPLTLARWYLDSRMIDMLCAYLSPAAAKKQLAAVPEAGLVYQQDQQTYQSHYYHPANLLDAYDAYIKYSADKNWQDIAKSANQHQLGLKHDEFLLAVGKAQVSLPMHFLLDVTFVDRPSLPNNALDYSKQVNAPRISLTIGGVELRHKKGEQDPGEDFNPLHAGSELGKKWIILPAFEKNYVARIVHAFTIKDKETGLDTQKLLMSTGWFDSQVQQMKLSKALMQRIEELRKNEVTMAEQNIKAFEEKRVLRKSL